MSNWTNPAMKKTQLEDIHQKSGNATKTSVAETSLKVGRVKCYFLGKYLIGPIQKRTLTLATYATKPSVAETNCMGP